MQLKQLLNEIDFKSYSGSTLDAYSQARDYFHEQSASRQKDAFQSPSINPTSLTQRGKFQSDEEHSVYQRSDYTPRELEASLNSSFTVLRDIRPVTLCFNSGMAAISTVLFYLKMTQVGGDMYMGENTYFETKWLANDYPKVYFYNEYDPIIENNAQILWTEYPVNCTQPTDYPFDLMPHPANIIEKFIQSALNDQAKKYFLVIDYTLFYLKFDVNLFLKEIPDNLTVFFISSLQKHRGYGLDLTNLGMVTFYSKNKDIEEDLTRLRAITGTSVTQEMVWTLPKIQPDLVNKIIFDSGVNAKNLYSKIKNYSKNVTIHFSDNGDFLTSFIFLKINQNIMANSSDKPYVSDRLISHLILAATKHNVILINGTSFGWPFTRIFKNSERYHNTDSIRVAIGYDEELVEDLDLVFKEGITAFEASL